MDTDQAHVTLSVSGADQRIAITENTTAATLFDAVADALDASTVKLLHKGKRLARRPFGAGHARVMPRNDDAAETSHRGPEERPDDSRHKGEARARPRERRWEDFAQHPEYKFCRIEAVKRFDGRSGPHRFEAENY